MDALRHARDVAGPQKVAAPEFVLQREYIRALLEALRRDALDVGLYHRHAVDLADALVVPVAQARGGLGRETPGLAAVEQHLVRKYTQGFPGFNPPGRKK